MPSVDELDFFLELDDRYASGDPRIGEMKSDRTAQAMSNITLNNSKAAVTLAPTDSDKRAEEMDTAAEQVAAVFAGGGPIEYF